MKKDLQSYIQHDKDFNSESNSLEQTKLIVEKYDKEKLFSNIGLEFALSLNKKMPTTYIDIGSGNGWLLRKMSPYFEKVIGVEPSEKGIELAKYTTKDCNNVSFINDDMVDALKKLEIKEPVFMTTATVLNHIENDYVAHFLNCLNDLPVDSVLFFDERYDENINWKMWHVRSKDWWRSKLSGWQVIFLDINIASYPSGIYAVKVSQNKKLTNKKMDFLSKIFWFTNMIKNLCRRVLLKFLPK